MNLVVYRGSSFSQSLILGTGLPVELLAAARFLMDVKKRPKDKKPLLRLASESGGLLYLPDMDVLNISMLAEDTKDIKCSYGYYDVVALLPNEFGIEPKRLFGGQIDFRDMITDLDMAPPDAPTLPQQY